MKWLGTDYVHTRGEATKFIKSVPGLYRIYNKAGELLYAGRASNVQNRVCHHFNGKSKNTKDVCHEFYNALITYMGTNVHDASHTEMSRYERLMVHAFKPKYNKHFTNPNNVKDFL